VVSIIGIYFSLIAVSFILVVIAIYLSFKNWVCWREIELGTIKARVFLDKSFLDNNFKLTLITTGILAGLTGIHLALEYIELSTMMQSLDEDLSPGFYLIYYSVFPIGMLGLVLVTYIWYRLLHKKFG